MDKEQRVMQVGERAVAWFGKDGRRIHHLLKVYAFAKMIGQAENLVPEEQEIVEICGLVHDMGIRISDEKYQSSAGRYQEQEGPPIVRVLLQELGYPETIRERVAYIVGHHHTYDRIDGRDFQVLVEADFLVNIQEDGMGQAARKIVRERYFRTAAGIRLFDVMYGEDGVGAK